MKSVHKIVVVISILTTVICNYGCRREQQEQAPPEVQSSQNNQKTETARSLEGFQRNESPKKTPASQPKQRIIYFADLMKKNQFQLNGEYKKIITAHPEWLKYNISHHGKSKSIFHHPLGIPNTLFFPNIKPQNRTFMKFDIGVFTNNHPDFASDGVLFKIILRNISGEHLLFDKTLTEFDVWQTYMIDISSHAGQAATIELMTEPLQNGAYDWATWGTPRLVNPPIQEYLAQSFLSAERRTFSETLYRRNIPLPERAEWVERGWIVNAITTDIELPQVSSQSVIRNEIFVMEKLSIEGKSAVENDVITIAYLDERGNVVASSEHKISEAHQLLQNEYHVKNEQTIPVKVRLTLAPDYPPIVFLKQPVLYRGRDGQNGKTTPNVIVISLDTLRADRLGCYGYPKNISPNIDAFAEDAFIFTNAYSNSNWTLPSHLSMFTSLYPSQHRILHKLGEINRSPSYRLPYHYIPETFKKANYLTIAFTGGVFVHSRYGFNRGMDYHIENVEELTLENLRKLLALLEIHKNIPLFLFFHTYEIHDYFQEKSSHLKYIKNNSEKSKHMKLIDSLLLLRESAFNPLISRRVPNFQYMLLAESGTQYLNELYDGAIVYTDTLLGAFFDELRNMGLYDNSWIIITSDHGEGFGEAHNNNTIFSWHHGGQFYDDQIRVPLIIKSPINAIKEVEAGRIEQFVQLIDLSPTLSAIVEITPHQQFEGKNLISFLSSSQASSGTEGFSEDLQHRQFSIIKDNYKLIMTVNASIYHQKLRYTYELYDLSNDPTESINIAVGAVSSKHAPLYNALKQELHDHVKGLLSSSLSDAPTSVELPTPQTEQENVDEKHIQRLKDLGYL